MLRRPRVDIDASTFQRAAAELTETIAQKVLREGKNHIAGQPYTCFDLFVIIRHALWAYNFFAFVNADETRGSGYWRKPYTVHALPTIRSIIDSLYNVMAILDDPATNGRLFRLSGFRKKLKNLEEDERLHGNDPEWTQHLQEKADSLRLGLRVSGFDPDNMPPGKHDWPTLGKYIGNKPAADTEKQRFLRNLTLGPWREYSQISHGSFEGLTAYGPFYTSDLMRHEQRFLVDDMFPRMMSLHFGRGALLLLCICTEIQAYCRFGDARINERIHEVWDALSELYEAQELLNGRYRTLMERSHVLKPKRTPAGLFLP